MKAEFDARKFGAFGEGDEDETEALRTALDKAASRGGGLVRIRAGRYRSGPLSLGDGVELHLEEGAVISFIPDFRRYEPVFTRWEGVECWAMRPLLSARGARDVALTGSGALEGNGAPWWAAYRFARSIGRKKPETEEEKALALLNVGYEAQASGGGGRETQFLRPPLVQFFNCADTRIEGVTLRDSPFWNTHLVYCRGAVVRNVRFMNPCDAPNTDGLNIDSCADVLVENCRFDVGDDCLGLKSGSGTDGMRVGRPTERVTIRGCVMRAGHGGVVVGSETAGGVRDVLIEGCEFRNTDRGLRIKTRRGRGGTVEHIILRDCVMTDVLCPLVVNCYYGPGGPPADSPEYSLSAQPIDGTTPRIRGLTIDRLRADGCRAAAGFLVGLPESPIEDIAIIDSRFTIAETNNAPIEEAAMYRGLPSAAGRGIRLKNIQGLRLEGVCVEPPSVRAFERD